MKKYKNYSSIPLKYRFDLDSILQNQTIESLMQQSIAAYEKVLSFNKEQFKSPANFISMMHLKSQAQILDNKVQNYLSNKQAINLIDAHVRKLSEQYSLAINKINIALGSEINQIYQHATLIKKWIKLPEFKIWKKGLQFILNSKKHKLNDKVEEYLNSAAKGQVGLESFFSLLMHSETQFPDAIDSNDKKHKLTNATIAKLLESNDEKLRKSAFQNYNAGIAQHKNTLSALLIARINQISSAAAIRKYDSSVHMLLYDDQIDLKIVQNLYKFGQRFVEPLNKYNSNSRKFFKQKYQ